MFCLFYMLEAFEISKPSTFLLFTSIISFITIAHDQVKFGLICFFQNWCGKCENSKGSYLICQPIAVALVAFLIDDNALDDKWIGDLDKV